MACSGSTAVNGEPWEGENDKIISGKLQVEMRQAAGPHITTVPYPESLCVCRQNQVLTTLEPDRDHRQTIVVVSGQ